MLQIPDRIKIGGLNYKVSLVDPEIIDNSMGSFNPALGEIQIRNDIRQEQKEATLLHEILHAINNEMEEKEVEALAQALYQVLSDNNLLSNDQ